MERLAAFRPHLTGAVWRGTATRLNSICIDLFCDDSKSAELALIDQRVDYDVSSVDGPRGRVLDVLNLHVPSPRSPGGVHVALTVRDYDDLRGALQRDARGRSDRGDLAALRAREAGVNRRPSSSAPPRSPPSASARAPPGAALATTPRTRRRRTRRSTSGRSTFESVDGAPIAMAGWRGRPLLLNFWATWCVPCVIEMPLLDRFASEQCGERLASAGARGRPARSGAPLRRRADDRPCRWRSPARSASTCRASLGNVGGALPFTAAFDSTGAAVQRQLGAVSSDLLAGWVNRRRASGKPPICRQLAAKAGNCP